LGQILGQIFRSNFGSKNLKFWVKFFVVFCPFWVKFWVKFLQILGQNPEFSAKFRKISKKNEKKLKMSPFFWEKIGQKGP